MFAARSANFVRCFLSTLTTKTHETPQLIALCRLGGKFHRQRHSPSSGTSLEYIGKSDDILKDLGGLLSLAGCSVLCSLADALTEYVLHYSVV